MYSKRADGRVRKRFCSGKEMGKEPGQAGNLIFTVPARVVVTTRVAYLFTVVIASLSWMRLCRARVYLGWSGHLVSFVIPACIRLFILLSWEYTGIFEHIGRLATISQRLLPFPTSINIFLSTHQESCIFVTRFCSRSLPASEEPLSVFDPALACPSLADPLSYFRRRFVLYFTWIGGGGGGNDEEK
jgi:hypothetical protein